MQLHSMCSTASIATVLATLAIVLATTVCAEAADNKGTGEASKMMPVPPAPGSPTGMTTARGEVKKVDRAAGTIAVQHGPVVNLQMPATTTVFRVKDRAMLDQIKPGDKINFSVEHATGLVTKIAIERPK
jgi:Cu(I)/Ag(I) efflux system protein CusF